MNDIFPFLTKGNQAHWGLWNPIATIPPADCLACIGDTNLDSGLIVVFVLNTTICYLEMTTPRRSHLANTYIDMKEQVVWHEQDEILYLDMTSHWFIDFIDGKYDDDEQCWLALRIEQNSKLQSNTIRFSSSTSISNNYHTYFAACTLAVLVFKGGLSSLI